jgi:superfamily I DNA/RNA helicase
MCVTVPSGGRFVQNGFDGCNSKGLEWPRVFILLDSFTFGKRKGPPSPEENNIRYVAITRAQATLVEVTGRRMR